MTRHTILYRFFGQFDELLYVGITHRLNERLSAHKREKSWDQVVRITLDHFSERETAVRAEIIAIRTEHPKWNIVGRAPDHRRTRQTSAQRALSRWPDAVWISKSDWSAPGQSSELNWASVAYCRVTSVMLFGSRDEAEDAKARIDRTACGGRCHSDHEVVQL